VSVGPFAAVCGDVSLYRAATAMIGVLPWDRLRTIARELAELPAEAVEDGAAGPRTV